MSEVKKKKVVKKLKDSVKEVEVPVNESAETSVKEPVNEPVKEPVKEPEISVKDPVKNQEISVKDQEISVKDPVKDPETLVKEPKLNLDDIKLCLNDLKNEIIAIKKMMSHKIACDTEVIQTLINERITPESSQSTLDWVQPEEIKKKQIYIEKISEFEAKVSGATYDYKEIIKSVGARFQGHDKSWVISYDSVETIKKLLTVNNVDFTELKDQEEEVQKDTEEVQKDTEEEVQ